MDLAVFEKRGSGAASPACECTHENALAARVTYRSYRLVFLEPLIDPTGYGKNAVLQEIEFVVDDGTSGTVRYVSPDGTGGGTSWADAAGLHAALTAAEAEDELWLKAGDYELTADLSAPTACAILGGFAGTETDKAQRDASARSTIVATAATNAIVMTDTSFCDYVLERLVFTNALHRAIKLGANGDSAASERAKKKSGAGLRAKDCAFVCNGSTLQDTFPSEGIPGRGAWIYTPKGAPVVFEDCVFDRNRNLYTAKKRHGINMSGMALNVNLCALTLTRCAFTDNGIPETETTNGADGRDGTRGAAIFAMSATIKATDCLFRGNRTVTNSDLRDGHVIHIGPALDSAGGCYPDGTTSFVGCRFVGNSYARNGDSPSSLVNFAPGTIGSITAFPILFDRCTFAYNVSTKGHAVGVQMDKGALTVKDSIFYRNQFNTNLTGTCGSDLYVGKSATAAVSYSLFTGTEAPWAYAETDGALTWGEGVLTGDPLFVTTTDEFLSHLAEDKESNSKGTMVRLRFTDDSPFFSHHLRGRAGYVDEATGARVKRLGKVESPAIDAGDPAADCANEPVVEGATPRLNLGYYGNTPWATGAYTPQGLLFFVR